MIRLMFLAVLALLGFLTWAQPERLPMPALLTGRQGLPQGFVAGIVQDEQGFIWMATRDGLCRYDGNGFKVFRPAGADQPYFSNLRTLQKDYQGRLWITSERADIALFDPRTEQFTNLSREIFKQQPLDNLSIQQAYADQQNRLWISFYGRGLLCFDMRTKQGQWFHHQPSQTYSLASDFVSSIVQDPTGTIWIATSGGLDHFQEQTKTFGHDNPVLHRPLLLPEVGLSSLYLRPNGEILIGSNNYITNFDPHSGLTRSYRLPADGKTEWGMRFVTDSRGGVYFDQRDRLFSFSDNTGPQLLSRLTPQTGFSSSLLIDHSDVLWLGTDGSGIRKYDLRSSRFQTAPYQVNFQTDLLTKWLGMPSGRVTPYIQTTDPYHFRYALDRGGWIWLNVGSSAIYRFNTITRQLKRMAFPVSFAQTISPMATDPQGGVWILNNSLLWRYDTVEDKWVRSAHTIDWMATNEVLQMVVDEEAFWVATSSRGLFRLDRKSGQMRRFVNQPRQPTSISNNALFCLSADPQDRNRLWIGTFGSGLCAFDKRTGQCQRITEQNGLPNNVVYSALPDGEGYLWMGTNKGLCRMNRKTFNIQVYTTEDGLLANEFNRFHYLQLSNDQVLMGGIEGITAFQPSQFQEDAFEPKVELTALQINNREVEPGKASPLAEPIHVTNALTLNHNQNFITASFAALQFNRPGKNSYRYQLTGIDTGWVESRQPQVVYTALPPGKYTLLLNASNTSGRWSPYIRKLAITIDPPWWATWWAYAVYGCLVAGLVWYGFRLYRKRLQLQATIALRQQEARQLQELDEMKSRFFTNITHDFRTPLTLILSPMDALIADLTDTPYRKRLESVQRNAEQLLGLINQVLDFSKLDAQTLSVHESRSDLAAFVGQTVQLFSGEAATKSIELIYNSDVAGEFWFDGGKLERILSNLIANALKFTPTGGRVAVALQKDDAVLLTVSDTGIGIPVEKQEAVFDRFFRVDGDKWDSAATGFGIGLALAKELTELQHGQISVESEAGKGTSFRVKLPYRRADEPVANTETATTPFDPVASKADSTANEEQPVILLVEDNSEMAEFISESLPQHYRIQRAANGAEGLQQAFSEMPDLIVSDVMMPVMDGYSFCKKIKEDERTNHIPVILLTAKAVFSSRLEGLTQGADDYLTKPFHVQELALRINNLLERQRRFREHIQKELSRPVNTEPDTKEPIATDPFLARLYTVIEEKLDDTLFSVEALAAEMNMSRVHLYRKVKALTGLPASDVIRNYRLKRATHYLRNGLNSSETAYQVGFDSPPYFAKCFRELYQMSPSEFARKN